MELAQVELLNRRVVQARAGVVDQSVDAPVALEGRGDEARDLAGVGDVGLHAQCAPELRAERLEPFGSAGRQDRSRSRVMQRAGGGRADA
jgi:hypothetical protein